MSQICDSGPLRVKVRSEHPELNTVVSRITAHLRVTYTSDDPMVSIRCIYKMAYLCKCPPLFFGK